ncbi:MAG: DUF2279 domain-containing protein [Ignavibacteriaceae bacterium]|nr:DUF2279 domain-containing protein [Ignavibacteriaceae bacterium]
MLSNKMRILVISLSLIFTIKLNSQPILTDSLKEVDYLKIGIISGVTAGAFVYGHAIQNDMWWKGEKSDFKFNWREDWEYALGSDKLGHFFFPYMASKIYTGLFIDAGLKKRESQYISASLLFLYQTYVEIRDGFSKEWGFSWGDFTANLAGSIYPILKEEIDPESTFLLKVSYYPSERFKNNSNRYIIDDYESTYYWLTINIDNFLKEQSKGFWTKFINLSIGYSVKNLDFADKYPEFYLSIDFNLKAIEWDFPLWQIIQEIFTYYKLPAPAIRISPGFTGFMLKF